MTELNILERDWFKYSREGKPSFIGKAMWYVAGVIRFGTHSNILKETSNAKSGLMLLIWPHVFFLRFVLYDMRLVNAFIITMYGVMNYSLLMPNLVAFYAKLNEI